MSVAKDYFHEKLNEFNKSNKNSILDEEEYNTLLEEVKEAHDLRKNNKPLSSKHYRRIRRYDVLKIGNTEKLIESLTGCNDESTIRYVCKIDELYDILESTHLGVGHKRTRVMEYELKKKYSNITRQIIEIFLKLCEQCQLKKKIPKRGLVVRPIRSDVMNSRCQVDLIDMQSEPDEDFRFIMNYQDHLTKFTILRPLKTKSVEEVAKNLMDIFCVFGAPCILQCDNGREFTNKIISQLASMWPGMKLVHGKPRHSQSQGSVERSNQDVRDMLIARLSSTKSNKWADELKYIQSFKNRAVHHGTKTSPYEAMFGEPQKIGLADSSLFPETYKNIKTEEELEEVLCNMQNMCNDHPQIVKISDDIDSENIEFSVDNINHDDETIYQKCSQCDNYVHITPDQKNESKVTCLICSRKQQINIERMGAKNAQEKQALKMLSYSNTKFSDVEIGTNVAVSIPDIDRGRTAPRNVLAMVMDNNSHGLYKLGTRDGVIDRLYARNEFIIADDDFIKKREIPTNSLSLRTASEKSSGSRQGFIYCHCKRFCIDKKCKCRNKNLTCNSKCHRNSSCTNK